MSNNKRWSYGAIVYQIYPRSFYDANGDGIGDIAGIIEKLDYIKGLGINALWLSPFYPSPMADFGYDVADYCDVDPIFGSLEDMDKLLKEAHKRDIQLMVDLVPNHTSDEHKWFRESKQSREDTYSDWYIWRDPKGHDKEGNPIPPNNWIEVLTGGPAWEWEPARQQFYLHSFDVRQPDLNWANPEVREAIKNVMRFWLDKGIDGFRVDAVPFMAKDPMLNDEPVNPHYKPGHEMKYGALLHPNNHGWPHLFAYLSEMASVLKEPKYKKSHRFMVMEAYPDGGLEPVEEYLKFYEGVDPAVAAPFNFEGLNLPWQAKEWHQFLKKFHVSIEEFNPLCVSSYAFGNHDQPRMVSRLGEAAARSAAILLLTLPGMVFIYNGDELGMKNGDIPPDMVQDPQAKGGANRDPERTPVQWTTGKNAGFTTAARPWLPIADNYKTHNVATESKDADSFLSLYRQLGGLRNDSAALKLGTLRVINTGNDHVLGYKREHEGKGYLVLVNFSNKACTLNLDEGVCEFVLSSVAGYKNPADFDKLLLHANEAIIFSY